MTKIQIQNNFIFLLIFYSLLSCYNSRKLTGHIKTRTYSNERGKFVDKYIGDSLIERRIYWDDKLGFQYPIKLEDLKKVTLNLRNSKFALLRSQEDTIEIHSNIPLMNRAVHVKGAVISLLSDSSFIIRTKPNDLTSDTVKFYVSLYQGLNEPRTEKYSLVDSLILPIK